MEGYELANLWRKHVQEIINSSPVAKAIGNDYQFWEDGDIIMVSAPTGTGKTHFIRNVMLDPLRSRNNTNQPILYFVNRAILREQLLYDLSKDLAGGKWYSSKIEVYTYQHLETDIINRGEHAKNYWAKKFSEFRIVVFDECHYFISDSTYNTNTYVSFDFLNSLFLNRIRIYMSATCDELATYLYLLHGMPTRDDLSEYTVRWKFPNTEKHYYYYTIPKDYSYLNIHSFRDADKICKLVESCYDGYKWLIFVDSKTRGRSIIRDMKKASFSKNEDLIRILLYTLILSIRKTNRQMIKSKNWPRKIALAVIL